MMIEKNCLTSILLYGPPGSGKTTIASLYAKAFDANFISFSATTSRMSELKKEIAEREKSPLFHRKQVVFVDEIHRFNKAQQDTFLPMIEKGGFILIGATTENPSFALNSALLSRLKTFKLNSLDVENLDTILSRFLKDHPSILLSDEAKTRVLTSSAGDARTLFSLLELVQLKSSGTQLELNEIESILKLRPANYDKHDDQHFNLISALHKSMRGSDPDSALYWLCRMLHGGEDPHYLLRRLMRMASEDIGLADPNALRQVIDAQSAFKMLGSPEGELAIANCVIYLSLAPKSNSGYSAYKSASELAQNSSQYSPPMHILNGANKWMKNEGYGKGYKYDHDEPYSFSGQNYFPDEMKRESFYTPKMCGFERELSKRIQFFAKLRAEKDV